MKNAKVVLGIGIVALIVLYIVLMRNNHGTAPEEQNPSLPTLTTQACEQQKGRVVYGIGPAPVCEEGETSIGNISDTNAIEGAICCIKSL